MEKEEDREDIAVTAHFNQETIRLMEKARKKLGGISKSSFMRLAVGDLLRKVLGEESL